MVPSAGVASRIDTTSLPSGQIYLDSDLNAPIPPTWRE